MTSELRKKILHCFAIIPSAKHCLHDIDSMLDYKFSSTDISTYLSNMVTAEHLESAGMEVCDKQQGSHRFYKITKEGMSADRLKAKEKKKAALSPDTSKAEAVSSHTDILIADSFVGIKQLLDEAEAAIQSVKRILYGD